MTKIIDFLFRESVVYGIGGVVLLVGGMITDSDKAEIVGLIFVLYANLLERIDTVKTNQ